MNAAAPWHARGIVAVVVAHGVCMAAVVLAWRAMAGRDTVSDQVLWLNVAVIGAVASGIVNGGWLLRLRRDVAGRRRALLGHLDRGDVADASPHVEVTEPLVTVAGMRLVHRASCALVAGKSVEPAANAGEACGWCRP